MNLFSYLTLFTWLHLSFCGLDFFPLPERSKRGYSLENVSQKEQLIRTTYNLGTEDEPCYAAYDGARSIWLEAPKVQFFKIPIKGNI